MTALNLARTELQGSLPPDLGSLQELCTLDLSNNDLEGPNSPELAQLVRLEVLDLSQSTHHDTFNRVLSELHGLSGAIPPELGQLTALRVLDLANNRLHDAIPLELGQFTALEILQLSNNRLHGPLPSELGRRMALRVLHLDNNQFSGGYPSETWVLALAVLLCTWWSRIENRRQLVDGLSVPGLGPHGNSSVEGFRGSGVLCCWTVILAVQTHALPWLIRYLGKGAVEVEVTQYQGYQGRGRIGDSRSAHLQASRHSQVEKERAGGTPSPQPGLAAPYLTIRVGVLRSVTTHWRTARGGDYSHRDADRGV